MRNAVIMMTANPTEDVVADSPPSAPSGRFGGLVWSGGANGHLPPKDLPQRRCVRTWGRFRRRHFLLNPTRSPSITGFERGILVKQSEY